MKRSPKELARQQWMANGSRETWDNYAGYLESERPIEQQIARHNEVGANKILHILLMVALIMGLIWFASL